jgi:hypothetical protein
LARVRRGQALSGDLKKVRRCVGRRQIRIGHHGTSRRRRDVSLDGQRFLAIKPTGSGSGQGASVEINVVLNWFTELRERIGN